MAPGRQSGRPEAAPAEASPQAGADSATTPGAVRTYTLLGADGTPRVRTQPGTFGGNARGKLYGRLDCPAARRALAQGGYAPHRVFFPDEATAVAAGYRPCAACLPVPYAAWRRATGGR